MDEVIEDLTHIQDVLRGLRRDFSAEQLQLADGEVAIGPLPRGDVEPWSAEQLAAFEADHGVNFPPNVAEFLKWFGDPSFGPMGWSGITRHLGPHSALRFPFPAGSRGYAIHRGTDILGEPADAAAKEAYEAWAETSAGGVALSDLGCALTVWLILTGDHAGDVWISGNGAVGPFWNSGQLVVGDWMQPVDESPIHWRFEQWFRYWMEHVDLAVREVLEADE